MCFKDKDEDKDMPLQVLNGVPSERVTHGRLPSLVLCGEFLGYRVERVVEERIRHRRCRTVRLCDRNVIQSDDLVWREGLARPVPVRGTQIGSRLLPRVGVVSVSFSDLDSVLLNQLL